MLKIGKKMVKYTNVSQCGKLKTCGQENKVWFLILLLCSIMNEVYFTTKLAKNERNFDFPYSPKVVPRKRGCINPQN